MNHEQPENPVQPIVEPSRPIPETLMNDVHGKFESKLDPYFSSKSKDRDTWTRRSSIKLFGKWT